MSSLLIGVRNCASLPVALIANGARLRPVPRNWCMPVKHFAAPELTLLLRLPEQGFRFWISAEGTFPFSAGRHSVLSATGAEEWRDGQRTRPCKLRRVIRFVCSRACHHGCDKHWTASRHADTALSRGPAMIYHHATELLSGSTAAIDGAGTRLDLTLAYAAPSSLTSLRAHPAKQFAQCFPGIAHALPLQTFRRKFHAEY